MTQKDITVLNDMIKDLNIGYLHDVDIMPGRFEIEPFAFKTETEKYNHNNKFPIVIHDYYFKTVTELTISVTAKHSHSTDNISEFNTDLESIVRAFVKKRI